MASQSDVLKAESTFFGALVGTRVDELEKLLTEDFSLADLSGGLMSKAALIQAVGSGQLRLEAIEPVEATVRFYGPTAIVTGRTEMRGALARPRLPPTADIPTCTWSKRGSCASHQLKALRCVGLTSY
jgi:hypothetical protein